MDYAVALVAGKLALVLVVLATMYYFLRTVLVNLVQRKTATGIHLLRLAVSYARSAHPYIATLAILSAAYHGFTMWQFHTVNAKVLAGLGTAVTLACMGGSGWTLKLKPADTTLRTAHRSGMVVVLTLLLVHRVL
jgi:hypothetical protein